MAVEVKMKKGEKDGGLGNLLQAVGLYDSETYTSLVHKNVKFSMGFYSIIAQHEMFSMSVTLPVSTTIVLKGGLVPSDAKYTMVRKLLLDFFISVSKNFFGVDTKEEEPMYLNVSMNMNNSQVHGYMSTHPYILKEKANMKPTQAINLYDAYLLGQKTNGTSSGSVYTVVAITDTMKLAVRTDQGKVSFRAEGKLTVKEKASLFANGFTYQAAGHYSIHFESSNVPFPRILGAMLMGLELEFDQQTTHVPTE